jgi:hypothetical protein
VHFEVLEQTLRLRVVSGPVDKKFFFSWGIACPIQYVCIKIQYFRYRSRSKVLIFYLSFRKAGNRRRYFSTRYLQISGTFLVFFLGWIVSLYGNIFSKYDQVECGVGATELYPAFLIDLYSVQLCTHPAVCVCTRY